MLSGAGFTDSWAATNGASPGLTFPSGSPTERIDFIFVKGVTPTQAQLEFQLPSVVSDHLGVSARVRVP